MRHNVRIALVVICSFLGTGCCVDQGGFADGISLRVSDAATGTGILTDTLWATARGGDYVDMLVVTSFGPEGDFVIYTVARGRRGWYVVTVEANGYEPWREVVWLKKGGFIICRETEAELVEVRLQPLSES